LNLDSANIAFTLLKAGADGLPIGPLVLGMSGACTGAQRYGTGDRECQRYRGDWSTVVAAPTAPGSAV
jgi:hypothetical protein